MKTIAPRHLAASITTGCVTRFDTETHPRA
jgi:hypothetical protein